MKSNRSIISTILLLAMIMGSCSASKNTIHEDRLYIIRTYVGDFQGSEVMNIGWLFKRKVTRISTTRAEFYLIGEPKLNIPVKTGCYVKYFPEHIPNTVSTIPILYFTWNGTYDMYQVWQNVFTGEVY